MRKIRQSLQTRAENRCGIRDWTLPTEKKGGVIIREKIREGLRAEGLKPLCGWSRSRISARNSKDTVVVDFSLSPQ